MSDTEFEGGLTELVDYVRRISVTGLSAEDHPGGGKYITLPEGYTVHRLAPEYETPPFATAHPVFVQVDSFVAYVNDFKQTDRSRIFADLSSQVMTAVLDYHSRAEASTSGAGTVAHKAGLTLRHSPEWEAWAGIHNRGMTQLDFANFVEEHQDTIVSPSAADLLEMVQNFQDNRTVIFQSKIDRTNGTMKFAYAEEEGAKPSGSVKMPERLLLRLAIYEGEAESDVMVFVRTNVQNGKLTITVKMHKVENLKREAFERIVEGVAETTGLFVAFGSPAGLPRVETNRYR